MARVDSVLSMSVSIGSHELPELRDAHEAENLGPYLRDVWSRRSYMRDVAVSELRHRQVTTVLGSLWHLLNPALTIGIYYLVFGVIVQTDRGVDNFLVFLTMGLFIFQFGQKSTIDGARSVVSNKGLIKAVRFPRVILPLTSTYTELLASLPTFAVAYVVALISGVDVTWRWLMLVPLLALMTVFNAGTAMIAGRLTTHFVDMTQILPFIFRLLLYVSGVIFSVDAYVDGNGFLNTLFTLNPYYCFISLGRWTLLAGNLQTDLLISAIVWSIVIFVGGFAWFRAAEGTYARD
jgi:teichoic acid transport system permease protein